ncbi:MAG: choice-of-anchor D domain-containing protein, partial [bacterium]|nr:choice-of-anchor D domain-containing protein [bacterium]
GVCSATLSIANNDANENPYNFTIQGTGTVPAEIDVRWWDNNQSIADGDTTPSTGDGTDFGSTDVSGGSVIHSFKIHNTGNANLNLTGNPKVSLSGCSGFSMVSQPASPVAPGGSRTFSVEFNPTAAGVCSATLSIANNDANENPYNFTIQGTGTVPAEIDVRWWDNNQSIADG